MGASQGRGEHTPSLAHIPASALHLSLLARPTLPQLMFPVEKMVGLGVWDFIFCSVGFFSWLFLC